MKAFYRRAILLLLLIALTGDTVRGQDDKWMERPRGFISFFGTRPNFYDTKLTDAQKEMLTPLPEDRAAFATFLQQDHTGIFRLHPKGKYEPGRMIDVAQAATDMILPVLGGGAYYSFTERTIKRGPWSDIRLEDNRLSAAFKSKAICIFTSLGDVPVESVTARTHGFEFLTRLKPPKTQRDVAALVQNSFRGFNEGGSAYSSSAPAMPDTTYVLRSILYKKEGPLVYPNEPYHRARQEYLGYDGSDVLVAFRVIRLHEDGSVTILWKRLQELKGVALKGGSQRFTIKDIKELMPQKVVKAMSFTQVIAFLDANGIQHTPYVDAPENGDFPPGTRGFVYATIPDIERKIDAVFDLEIRFSFNEKGGLIDWKLQKSRGRTRRSSSIVYPFP